MSALDDAIYYLQKHDNQTVVATTLSRAASASAELARLRNDRAQLLEVLEECAIAIGEYAPDNEDLQIKADRIRAIVEAKKGGA